MWHHPPLLQCHPKPNTIPKLIMTTMLERFFLLLVNYIFAPQVKHNSHHTKDETAGERFWPLWLQAEIQTTTSETVSQVSSHDFLRVIYFTMSNDAEASLWLLWPPCKQRTCMTDNKPVCRFWVLYWELFIFGYWHIKNSGYSLYTWFQQYPGLGDSSISQPL